MTYQTISDLLGYLEAPQVHPPIRLNVGADWVPCPIELLCALIVYKGSTEEEMTALLRDPISPEDIQKALAIVNIVHKGAQIDIDRLQRDPKYAIHVQELPNLADQEESFRGCILKLSLNTLGCRVVQKLIEAEALWICDELVPHVVECALDVNGNHVIQKIVDSFPHSAEFIVNGIMEDPSVVKKLALHCYGCRVIQRIMARCTSDVAAPIFETLCADPTVIAALCEDVFGNYVAQHALEFGRQIDKDRIALCLATMDIVQLACSKYASNVVEKAIRRGAESTDSVMVTRLLINAIVMTSCSQGDCGIIALMKDRYGNYVVRAIMELGHADFASEVDIVKQTILANSHILKKFTFSWHLVESLNRMD